ADPRLRASRGGHGSGLRPRGGEASARTGVAACGRAIELVRVRRAQRGAVSGSFRMTTLALAQRPQEALTALDRLEGLCVPGSVQAIRSEVTSRHMGERTRAGDGVVAGAGRVEGRPIFCYAQDATYVGGSLGEAHAETIVRVM